MGSPGDRSDLDARDLDEIAREVGLSPREVRAVVAAADGVRPAAGAPGAGSVGHTPGASTADASTADGAAPGELVPPAPVVPAPVASVDGIPERQLQAWADRLIDRTQNNRLLFFDPSQPSCQTVVAPDTSRMWELVTASERRVEIRLPPLPAGDVDDGSEGDGEERPLEAVIGADELGNRDLLLGGRSVRQTRAFVARLHRKANEEMVERGLQVAFLAFGLVRWRDEAHGDEGACPLLLVPVLIERENPSAPYTLRCNEDEPFLNPVLRAHLARVFSLELPELELPADQDPELEVAVAPYRRAVDRPGLRLELGCWLGYFTFHKLVMFEDLTGHRDHALAAPLLRQLMGQERAGAPAEIRPGDVTALFDPAASCQIRDADSSQQACIEMARRGDSFVIVGPPGTGKSQTISNIIAELLGMGRSVLFVAEKMAALEVVERRLAEDGLGEFCLELHSHKAHKRTVIEELARALTQAAPPPAMPEAAEVVAWAEVGLRPPEPVAGGFGNPPRGPMSIAWAEVGLRPREPVAGGFGNPPRGPMSIAWLRARDELDAYVRALHENREPLGKSVFEALGRLAALADAPLVRAEIEEPELLTPEQLASYRELARRLAELHRELMGGADLPWHGYKLPLPGVVDGDVLRRDTAEIDAAAAELRSTLDDFLADLGLRRGGDPDWAWLRALAELLDGGPGFLPRWMLDDDPRRVLALVRDLAQRAAERNEAQRTLRRSWNDGVLAVAPDWLSRWSTAEELLAELGGAPSGGIDLLSCWPRLGKAVADGPRLLDELEHAWSEVRNALALDDLPEKPDPVAVEAVVVLLDSSLGLDRMEARWATRDGWEEAERSWAEVAPRIEAWRTSWAALQARWSDGILEADLARAQAGFAGPYRGALRVLRPAYWNDRKLLLGLSKGGALPAELVDDLAAVRTLQEQRAAMGRDTGRFSAVLGARFGGLETDVALLERALAKGRRVRELPSERDWAPVARRIDERRASVHLEGLLARLRVAAEGVRGLRRDMEGLWSVPPVRMRIHDGVRALIGELGRFVRDTAPLRHQLVGFWCGSGDLDRAQAVAAFALRERIEGIAAALEERRDELATLFEADFRGIETDWQLLQRKLGWCLQLEEMFRPRPVPVETVERAAAGAATRLTRLDGIMALWQRIWSWLGGHFELPVVRRGDHHAAAFNCTDLAAWTRELAASPDQVEPWCRFRDLMPELRVAGLGSWVDGVQQARLSADQIWPALERSLHAAWYDAVARRDPRLNAFEPRAHEDRVASFRSLDRSLLDGARRVVAGRLAARRPSGLAFAPGGQLGILKREAAKRRRQMPLPRLFSAAPEIIRRLKPCLLMSPISVAQFLDPGMWTFDTVIFDEASQLCVEDAVGCLLRARQAIVVGDPKQLPPTSFFKAADEEPGASEEPELPDEGDYTSLIDAGRAHWRERRLQWHYRSRHDSLIAFSNDHFYDNDLIIFPSAQACGPDLGVTLHHVADGSYDRGRSATNRGEAEAVAELVLEHFRRHGRRLSLGVMAFSIRQANLIEDVLNERRRRRPEPALEPCFSGGGSEPFFVKNLENVQGDERDVMLICVGYGKDAEGNLSYNFGPLNQKGGPNRLNVAVTRARQRLVLVSSLRASDLDPARLRSEGGRLLRDYLEFAGRGDVALHGDAADTAGGELESAVAAAITGLGYRVVPRVGCGRFRVDLGVVAPGDGTRFVLGVLCDGAMYRDAATARDRDRLREEILQRQYGWELFRIWAPEWVKNRTAVLERLRAAIERARARAAEPPPPAPEPEPVAPPPSTEPHPAPEDDAGEDEQRGRFGSPYSRVELPDGRRSFEFHAPEAVRENMRLVRLAVEGEGPIHFDLAVARLRDAWSLKRSSARLLNAMEAAVAGLLGQRQIEVRTEPGGGRFLWPVGRVPALPRWPGAEGDRRAIDCTPTEELAEAAAQIVAQTCGIDEEELVRAVARYFGWQQISDATKPRLAAAVEHAVAAKRIARRGSELVLP